MVCSSIRATLVLSAFLCGISPASARDDVAVKKAAAQGKAEAEAEIRDGRERLYTFGTPMDFSNFSKETGLPFRNFGCVVDEKILARVRAHNERMEEHLKSGQSVRNSFKRYAGEILDPEASFKAYAQRNAPVNLTTDGERFSSPDGESTIEVVAERKKIGKKRLKAQYSVRVLRRDGEVASFHLGSGQYDWVWGPDGSGFGIARDSSQRGHTAYWVHGLRGGEFLNLGVSDDGKK